MNQLAGKIKSPQARSAPSLASARAGIDPVARQLASRVWFFCACFATLGLLSANPLETAVGALVPAILFQLLWRTGETPIFLFCTSFQWLQAYVPVLAANLVGETLSEGLFGEALQTAARLSLIGVVVLATGISWAQMHLPQIAAEMDRRITRLNPKRLIALYLGLWLFSTVLEYAFVRVPALRTFTGSLLLLKWIPLYLLATYVFRVGKDRLLLVIPATIEVVVGITGFFSSFKSVLFLLFVVSIGSFVRSTRIPWGKLALVAVPAISLVIVWQGIKVDHRRFINAGSGEQVVVVGFRERVTNLGRLITRLDADAVKGAFESGIDRIGYLDYFAYSIQNVPAHIPHERGALWFATIKHILMPRILFPNKEAVDDNERTAKYALADVRYNKGTSISIGYIGESYIDFGRYGMFVPILLLGIMYGLIYRWFILNAPNPLFGTAFGTSLLLIPASPLETSNIKIMGTILAGFIVFAVIARFAGAAAWKWMCGR